MFSSCLLKICNSFYVYQRKFSVVFVKISKVWCRVRHTGLPMLLLVPPLFSPSLFPGKKPYGQVSYYLHLLPHKGSVYNLPPSLLLSLSRLLSLPSSFSLSLSFTLPPCLLLCLANPADQVVWAVLLNPAQRITPLAIRLNYHASTIPHCQNNFKKNNNTAHLHIFKLQWCVEFTLFVLIFTNTS